MEKLIVLILMTIIFLGGCVSCGKWRGVLKFEAITSDQNTINGRNAIINIGMTKDQVLAAWGKPMPDKYGENIWMYSTDMNMNDYEKGRVSNATLYQIFFEKGKIIKIEKDDEGEYKFRCSTVDL